MVATWYIDGTCKVAAIFYWQTGKIDYVVLMRKPTKEGVELLFNISSQAARNLVVKILPGKKYKCN